MPNSYKVFFLIVISLITAGFVYFYLRINELSQNEFVTPISTNHILTTEDNCGVDCQEIIKEEISKALAALPTPIVQTKQVVSTKQTTYIPLGSGGSTNSTDWTDVAGSQVYIDAESDYGKAAVITFEASLKVTNGGKTFARLFDETHGIAVDGSEVSVTSENFSQSLSGTLALWRGRNLYKVQIKSLNMNMATLGSGRIKVVY